MSEPAVLPSARRLHDVLEDIAAALARPDVETLLSSERALEDALGGLSSTSPLSSEDRAAVRAELERARLALLRCQRLGAALNDVIRLTLASITAPQGGAEYGPHRPPAERYAGRAMDARV